MAAEGIFKNSPKCFIGTNLSLLRLATGAVLDYLRGLSFLLQLILSLFLVSNFHGLCISLAIS